MPSLVVLESKRTRPMRALKIPLGFRAQIYISRFCQILVYFEKILTWTEYVICFTLKIVEYRMKKEWCTNFSQGSCRVVGELPSLAKEMQRTVKLPDEIMVLTDHNDMLNFWGLYGHTEEYRKALDSGVFPESITLRIPNSTTEILFICTASNCRSRQKQCSHYG
jgi:hypothetical protein